MEEGTDTGLQVLEGRLGDSSVVELICPRQHCYGSGVQKRSIVQSSMIS